MKSKSKSSSQRPIARAQVPATAPDNAGRPAGGRAWWFRLAAVTLVPLLLLGGLELALRLAGFGYSTRFFLPGRIDGERVWVDNPKFGLRFFPAALARSPSPMVMSARKPDDVYRIFLLGESAALGDPRPAYGMGRYLEVLLNHRFPTRRFEVIPAAMTAINSHALVPIARDCARHQGDLWIVYMGNNEMQGPFGANTIFGPQTPGRTFIRANLALKSTRLGQALAALHERLFNPPPADATWTGLALFQENQLSPDDPRRAVVHRHFAHNLETIVQTGLRARAGILLSSVASNLKDCPPFASLHRSDLPAADRSDWEQLFELGSLLAAKGQTTEALRTFDLAAELDPLFAELPFRQGLSLLALANPSAALRRFSQARDTDALPFRADSRLNAIVAETAQRHRHRGVAFFDAATWFTGQGPDGIPGHESFYEHVHLTFEGNYRLARELAGHVESFLPETVVAAAAHPDWASQEFCERRLGLTDWNRLAVLESVLLRVAVAPFTNQLNALPRLRLYHDQLMETRFRLFPGADLEAREIFAEALQAAPKDPRLHENFAEFLEGINQPGEAVAAWQQVRDLLPHHHVAYFHLGRILSRLGRHPEARIHLEQCLALRPELVEARVELGLSLFRQGKPAEAMTHYLEARRRRPDHADAHYRLAEALGALERRPEAVISLREAIRLRPSHWEARYFLGVELALEGKVEEARTEFEAVTALRPGHALAHLNLGVALARQGHFEEALARFQETLQLDPGNQSARRHIETLRTLTRPTATTPVP